MENDIDVETASNQPRRLKEILVYLPLIRIASESIQPGKHHRLSPENAINPSTRNTQDTQIPAAIGMFNGQLPEIDSFGFKTLVKGDSPVVE
jgi:hypothetical protein